MLKEFKEFAMRGNVLDMAVGIIIGAAFGKIVSSLVEDSVDEDTVTKHHRRGHDGNVVGCLDGALQLDG